MSINFYNEIDILLKSNFSSNLMTFTDISKSFDVPFIKNDSKAYNFDNIIKKIIKVSPCSADAIYIKNSINFIEFKSGEIDKDKIKLKMVESLRFFINYFLNQLSISEFSIKVNFFLVVNSARYPLTTMLGSVHRMMNEKNRLDLSRFETKDVNGKKVYYDNIDIWDESSFGAKILSL